MGDGVHCERCGNPVKERKQRYCQVCRHVIKEMLKEAGSIAAPERTRKSRWVGIPIGKGRLVDGFRALDGVPPDADCSDEEFRD